jgi:hypothetical protein
MTIPTRFIAKCEFCPDEVDMRMDGVYQWTAGWVMQRKGGGGHGVSLPERANRWAHGWCIERKINGGTQGKMVWWTEEKRS